ncbi:MAG: transglycosylase domain-containing protein, partial [Actinomycetota bacterium]
KRVPKHTPSKRRKGFFRRFWWVFVLVPTLVIAALAGSLYVAYARIELPEALPPIRTSYLYDRNGTLLTPLHGAVDRKIVGLNQISENLQHAVLATEDAGFYDHPGIDVGGIISAAWTDLVKRDTVVGASTITQQLVKNVYAGEYVQHPNGAREYIVPPRTIKEKIREAMLAIKVEQELSKDQILAKYLNTVYFGHGAYGAEAAAQTYFNVAASELTVMQAAVLAAVLHAPSLYDPIKSDFDNEFRRDYTLDQMAKYRYITPDDARRMKEEKCCGIPKSQKDAESRISSPPGSEYFVEWTRSELFERYGSARVYGGGLQVLTTLDLKLQRMAAKAVEAHLPETKGTPDAALVTIDNATGEVLAMVGGRDWEKSKLNLATLPCEGCGRQAGSAFKPFTLAAALDQEFALTGQYWSGPSTITIPDERCATNGVLWQPTNAGDSSAGTVDLKGATQNSVNTVYAQLVTALDGGPDDVVRMAHRLGIESDLPSVCSITLGSVQINPLEMTNAYSTLASEGTYRRANPLFEVNRPNGQPAERRVASPAKEAKVDPNVANLVTSALQSVIQGGTGSAASIYPWPAAGKTGSSQDNVDAWFCGYTVQLTTCVWVGYPAGQRPLIDVAGVPVVYGGTIPAAIWQDFMLKAMAYGQEVRGWRLKQFPTDFVDDGTRGAPTPVSSPAPPLPPSPSETSPSETPASETPPSETPPSETPPSETPPSETP